MGNGDRMTGAKSALQKFGLPTAAGAIGAGAGLILTRKPSTGRSSLPDMKGVGDLFEDLRSKLDTVIGRDGGNGSSSSAPGRGGGGQGRQLTPDQIASRRREREQRRNKRRGRSSR
jgi:hypothetical protein